MQHYTVDTGHCRDSARSEVGPEVIRTLTPLLRPGTYDLPGFPGYSLRVTVADSTLAATVFSGPVPLVTAFVCLDAAGLREVLRITGAVPAVRLRAPCIIAQPMQTMVLDMPAVGWLGDFERCLGWAWAARNQT